MGRGCVSVGEGCSSPGRHGRRRRRAGRESRRRRAKTGEQAAQEDEIVATICYELGVTIREPARRKTGRVGGARRGVGSGSS